jgi:hypothetical protein
MHFADPILSLAGKDFGMSAYEELSLRLLKMLLIGQALNLMGDPVTNAEEAALAIWEKSYQASVAEATKAVDEALGSARPWSWNPLGCTPHFDGTDN